MSRLCVLPLIPVLLDVAFAITFYLPVHSSKCLQEKIHKDVLLTGDYEVSGPPKTTTSLMIIDGSGQTLYTMENATKGKFSFTTEYDDHFEVCFHSKYPMGSGKLPDQLVKLNMRHGVEAENYEEIEAVEKLTPLEARLRHLERLSQSIAVDFNHLGKRWRETQTTNDSTSTQVLLFSIISISCLSAVATWQVFYLRRFFKAKKLIE